MEIKIKQGYIFQYVILKKIPNLSLKYLLFLLEQLFISFCIEELLCDVFVWKGQCMLHDLERKIIIRNGCCDMLSRFLFSTEELVTLIAGNPQLSSFSGNRPWLEELLLPKSHLFLEVVYILWLVDSEYKDLTFLQQCGTNLKDHSTFRAVCGI